MVSLIPAFGKVYSTQNYVIKFNSDLWQVVFSLKTDNNDKTENMFKVVLNTNNPNQ